MKTLSAELKLVGSGRSLLLSLLLLTCCCVAPLAADPLQGELVIFHAGSLGVPFQLIATAFEEVHPGVTVLREAAGSRTCARKISELGRQCDIFASADYTVIDQLLIPEFAGWNIPLATNELVLAYHKSSRMSDELNDKNWYHILQRDDITYGRSDPDSDPCGYRSVLTIKLAETHYRQPGLTATLLAKDREAIRPRETDLLALLEVGHIDYLFIYRSVAFQHNLDILALPPEINLGQPLLADFYRTATLEIAGKSPGTTITKCGEPMLYGVTIPTDPPHPELALAFMQFLLAEDKGMRILAEQGQPGMVPSPTSTWGSIPVSLQQFALPVEEVD
jgi:molybdate/tungstate transport system substrate-binding protein